MGKYLPGLGVNHKHCDKGICRQLKVGGAIRRSDSSKIIKEVRGKLCGQEGKIFFCLFYMVSSSSFLMKSVDEG